MMDEDYAALFPHGRCECDGATCCGGRGPAAYRVTRKGRSMLVCTKCDLSSDTDKVLLVTKDDPAQVWMDFDALGAVCIMFKLAETDGEAA